MRRATIGGRVSLIRFSFQSLTAHTCEFSCSEAFFSSLFSQDNHEDKILIIQFNKIK